MTVAVMLLGLSMAHAQTPPEPARYDHLFTLGSKHGMNPRKALNSKPAIVVFGPPARPFALLIPETVTVDPERRIWITDRGTRSVHVYDPRTGGYREIRGGGGQTFGRPAGAASDSAGRVYVTDGDTGKVFVFTGNGEYERLLVGKGSQRILTGPEAVAVAPNRRTVLVADPPRHKVVAFNQEGEVIGEWGGPGVLDRPTSIVVAGTRTYVLDTGLNRVQEFASGGKFVRSLRWDGVHTPSAFAYDEVRRRFFVGNPRWEIVQVFTPEGRGIGAFGQSGDGAAKLRGPDSIYVDAEGIVYAVDSLHGRVLVFCDAALKDAVTLAESR